MYDLLFEWQTHFQKVHVLPKKGDIFMQDKTTLERKKIYAVYEIEKSSLIYVCKKWNVVNILSSLIRFFGGELLSHGIGITIEYKCQLTISEIFYL